MARPRTEEDTLEPILPKSPPMAPEPGPPGVSAAVEPAAAVPPRPGWERWLLLGCALVATLALVVCALRLNSIAKDERQQSCQARAYLEEQLDNQRGRFDTSDDAMLDRLAACIGVERDDPGD